MANRPRPMPSAAASRTIWVGPARCPIIATTPFFREACAHCCLAAAPESTHAWRLTGLFVSHDYHTPSGAHDLRSTACSLALRSAVTFDTCTKTCGFERLGPLLLKPANVFR